MPRVEVVIRVTDDYRSTLSQSTFQVGTVSTGLLMHGLTPQDLAQDLCSTFRDDTVQRLRRLGSDILPGEIEITTRGPTTQEIIRQRLTPFVGRAVNPEVRAEILREIENIRSTFPDSIPTMPLGAEPLAVDYSDAERRILTGLLPEVSMGARVGGSPVAEEDFEGLYQAPAPPEESNPISRRIRQALRQAVGGDSITFAQTLAQQGGISNQTLLGGFGLSADSIQEEVTVDLENPPPSPSPPRGGQTVGVMLDDAAYFDPPQANPVLRGDTHPSAEGLTMNQGATMHFQAIYGGDQYRHLQSAGIEPSFQTKHARVRGPKPSEDRTLIPSRYHRKLVI